MNWGVLSTADIAIKKFMPAIQRSDHAYLKAIASRDAFKARKEAKRFGIEAITGYEDLLNREDIEVVYIPLPNSHHFEWTMKALDKGKHVFLEKPAGCSYEEAKIMVEKSREKSLTLIENFHYHFHDQHKFVFEKIKTGTIGEVRCLRSSFGVPPFGNSNNIRYQNALGGGALMDMGVYVLNVCTFLLGSGFDVSGVFVKQNEELSVDIHGGVFLVNETKGISAQLAFGFDNYYQNNYEIWGSKGKIIVNRAFTPGPQFEPTIILEQNAQSTQTLTMPADDQYIKAIDNVEKITTNGNMETERAKILMQAELVDKVKKAIAVGR